MDRYIEALYDSLLGELVEPVPGVENAFAEGKLCEVSYGNVLDAYERLIARLNATNEDKDVEIILNSMMDIQRELCMKMYQYGAKFGIME